jgi:uncharacterized membrane protein
MSMIHKLNILIHVIAGTTALLIGIITLILKKGSPGHIRFGRYFLILIAVVVISGFLGWFFFRSNPFLLMLTILSGYVSYSGYRRTRLKEKRGRIYDAMIAFAALFLALLFLIWLKQSDENWSPSVIYPTVFSILLVTGYDLIRYFWLYKELRTWWLYEHIYKMLFAFSAIFSAFTGTVFPQFKPWSQVGPSMICIWLIVFYIFREKRKRVKISQLNLNRS